jgi:hypothetical protein
MRKGLIAIAALALGGCSGTWFDVPVQRTETDDTPESYYKFLLADSPLVRGYRGNKRIGPLQISALRRTVPPQPGDWMTCLRVWELGQQDTFIAVFIRDKKLVDFRTHVAIDGCSTEQYAPLPEVYVPPKEKVEEKHQRR